MESIIITNARDSKKGGYQLFYSYQKSGEEFAFSSGEHSSRQ
jgi:hypothetical protein